MPEGDKPLGGFNRSAHSAGPAPNAYRLKVLVRAADTIYGFTFTHTSIQSHTHTHNRATWILALVVVVRVLLDNIQLLTQIPPTCLLCVGRCVTNDGGGLAIRDEVRRGRVDWVGGVE